MQLSCLVENIDNVKDNKNEWRWSIHIIDWINENFWVKKRVCAKNNWFLIQNNKIGKNFTLMTCLFSNVVEYNVVLLWFRNPMFNIFSLILILKISESISFHSCFLLIDNIAKIPLKIFLGKSYCFDGFVLSTLLISWIRLGIR